MGKVKKLLMFVVSSLVVVAIGMAILNRISARSATIRQLITGA